MSLRLSRWTAVLVLPLLAGALLLMHGLDAGASEAAPHASVSGSAPHEHHSAPAHDEDHGCDDCAGHLMAACLAVVASIATFSLARRMIRGRWTTSTPSILSHLIRRARELLPPPDPVWVRLAVIQR